jgi:hypothetical protein
MTGAALFLASDDAHHITGSDMIAGRLQHAGRVGAE